MKKNYTKPEINVSRYEIEDVTMSVAGVTSQLFAEDSDVNTVKVLSYTEIFSSTQS